MSYRDFEIKTKSPDGSITYAFPTRGLKAFRESPFLENLVKCAKAALENETNKSAEDLKRAISECQFQQLFLVGASMTEAWKLINQDLVLNPVYKDDQESKSILVQTIDTVASCARALIESIDSKPLATFAIYAIKLANSLDELYYLV